MSTLTPAFSAALQSIAVALLGAPIDWALTGSLGFALQGGAVSPRDIDIQTDAEGAYAIAQRLADYVVSPVTYVASPAIRSHLGALEIAGVTVEVMGALQKRLPNGAWEPPVDVRLHRRWVRAADQLLPVLDLAYEEQAYRALGRTERADMLRQRLVQQSPDPGWTALRDRLAATHAACVDAACALPPERREAGGMCGMLAPRQALIYLAAADVAAAQRLASLSPEATSAIPPATAASDLAWEMTLAALLTAYAQLEGLADEIPPGQRVIDERYADCLAGRCAAYDYHARRLRALS